MSVNDLINKKLLLKVYPSKDKALKSLGISEKYFKKAETNFKIGLYDVTVLLAYNSMFHAARSLLFKDGFKERAHWAVVEYLREKYLSELKEDTINKLDAFRVLRHSAAYGLESKEDWDEAKLSLEFAEELLKKTTKIVR